MNLKNGEKKSTEIIQHMKQINTHMILGNLKDLLVTAFLVAELQ